jgi:hypothetical protein
MKTGPECNQKPGEARFGCGFDFLETCIDGIE